MKVSAKLAFGALGCALLISGIAVLSPRAVQAAVATLTRDQDNPARHPFATSCFSAGVNANGVPCFTPPIPAGQEVVIETVSISGSGGPNNVTLLPSITTTAAGVVTQYDLNPISDDRFFQPVKSDFHTAQSLRLYVDPGTVILCNVSTAKANSSLVIQCVISGYFVTLP